MKWGRVLSQSRRSGQGSGPGRASRRHDAAGQAGGRDAGRPEHRATTPDPFSPLPRVGLGHNCSPDTHALSTSSRTFHMFNIVSRAGRAAASPERFRAGTLPCRGRSRLGLCRRPPPRTPQVSSFSCHSRGAAGDTSRRGGRGAAWSGSGRLSARCARGIPGLVVLSLRTKRSRLR